MSSLLARARADIEISRTLLTDIISDWEASSRYNDDFSAAKADIEAAIELYEELERDILERLDRSDSTAGDSLSF